jgi:hypothetical protein
LSIHFPRATHIPVFWPVSVYSVTAAALLLYRIPNSSGQSFFVEALLWIPYLTEGGGEGETRVLDSAFRQINFFLGTAGPGVSHVFTLNAI